jgi:hypothetical protein
MAGLSCRGVAARASGLPGGGGQVGGCERAGFARQRRGADGRPGETVGGQAAIPPESRRHHARSPGCASGRGDLAWCQSRMPRPAMARTTGASSSLWRKATNTGMTEIRAKPGGYTMRGRTTNRFHPGITFRDPGIFVVAVRLSANRWTQYPQRPRPHAAAKINPWPVSHVSRSSPRSGSPSAPATRTVTTRCPTSSASPGRLERLLTRIDLNGWVAEWMTVSCAWMTRRY